MRKTDRISNGTYQIQFYKYSHSHNHSYIVMVKFNSISEIGKLLYCSMKVFNQLAR